MRLEFVQHAIETFEARHVLVDRVEEDRIEKLSHDLRSRRITMNDLMPCLFVGRLVAGGHGDDLRGAQMDGRRERRDETDPAVAVPRRSDFHGRKEEWQG
jgi:hypothetical protein